MIGHEHWTFGPVADRIAIVIIGLWPLYALAISWLRQRKRQRAVTGTEGS